MAKLLAIMKKSRGGHKLPGTQMTSQIYKTLKAPNRMKANLSLATKAHWLEKKLAVMKC